MGNTRSKQCDGCVISHKPFPDYIELYIKDGKIHGVFNNEASTWKIGSIVPGTYQVVKVNLNQVNVQGLTIQELCNNKSKCDDYELSNVIKAVL